VPSLALALFVSMYVLGVLIFTIAAANEPFMPVGAPRPAPHGCLAELSGWIATPLGRALTTLAVAGFTGLVRTD